MLAATLERDGHARLPALVDDQRCASLAEACGRLDAAGTRNMLALAWCGRLANELLETLIARGLLPRSSVAVQCTFFDKRAGCNWQVPFHQDLAIPVARRIEHYELSGWSRKEGQWFVQPPICVLHDTLALRLHIDACPEDNGALRVISGSHQHGRLDEAVIRALRASSEETTCTMAAGDAHLMRPLLLHASRKATHPERRRVLHFLFGPATLPHGLSWPAREALQDPAAA
ncbi:MAG: phytanoyl-CoA dioxygenase family protein [Moraxellaceae bacterium]|nr:phytanoyl-CoA dioxygenase family protein [Moraxellaceae bacterium]